MIGKLLLWLPQSSIQTYIKVHTYLWRPSFKVILNLFICTTKLLCKCHKPYSDKINDFLLSCNHCSVGVTLAYVLSHEAGAALQLLHTTRPIPISVSQPSGKCWIAHNWGRSPQFADHWRTVLLIKQLVFLHWWQMLSFHWTTLIQGAPDIPGAGYECGFTWLYTSETGYSIFV